MYLLLGYRAFVVKVIKKPAHLKLSRDLNFLREKSFLLQNHFVIRCLGIVGNVANSSLKNTGYVFKFGKSLRGIHLRYS